MIPDQDPINPGMKVRHDEGLLYEVEDVRQSTTGYEVSNALGGMVVNYTQLEQDSFPPDTKWSKDEADFREHFTPVALYDILTRDDFRAVYNPIRAGRVWGELVRGVVNGKIPGISFWKDTDGDIMTGNIGGDISRAIDWLLSNGYTDRAHVVERALQAKQSVSE